MCLRMYKMVHARTYLCGVGAYKNGVINLCQKKVELARRKITQAVFL